MSEEINIPNHWQLKKLGAVCVKITDGSHFSPISIPDGFPYITVKDIKKDDKIDFENCLKISKEDFEKLAKNDCMPLENDVLFSKDGTVGKVAIINYEKDFVVLSSIAMLRPNRSIIDSKFLFHILKSSKFLQLALDQKKGVAIRRIILRDLKEIEFLIPPIPEQQAIVSKIEELLSDLENGKQQLQIAQQQLKIYRQSLLKWAFEGKLTNKNVKDGELPKGWKNVKIEDIATIGTGATPLKGNNKYYEGGKIAWVTSGALNDEYVKEATDFVTELALKETNLSVYPKYTLLLAMYGEGKTRGKCSELLIDACTNQAIAAIHFKNHDNRVKTFLKYFLLKNYNDIRRLSSGGVQPNLNLGIVKKTIIPFPPLSEQQLIVDELESKLTVCDKIEETISQSLLHAEALRQSILKKAFEGKLI